MFKDEKEFIVFFRKFLFEQTENLYLEKMDKIVITPTLTS